ncbi:hypothetical protein LMG33818_002114 [Halomonadaceae bacterium LMG 33818]|uniref:GNAT family N-acetyltransferase n=1 Tax=Cernens ardua TaxID=3402176 RepID=UPI003EDC8477
MCVRLSLPSGESEESFGGSEDSSFEHTSSPAYPYLAKQLACFTGDAGWSASVIRDALLDSQREVWSILDGSQPLAFCVLHIGPFELEIEMIAVAPDHRRHGLATTLLRHAQSRVGALGKESLLLEVRRSNHAAQRLYMAQGMRQDGVRKGYYPVQDAICGESAHDGFSPIAGETSTSDHIAVKSSTNTPIAREDALLFSWAPFE